MKPPKDMGASVNARLLRIAKERGEDFQLVLLRYANERLLFRLAASHHREQFVLKGGRALRRMDRPSASCDA
jgi:predicted nucleotidyltransferase component of viral defense system